MDKMSLRTLDALTLVGLDEDYLNFDPQILTLVDAKKVALAVALIHNPNIIIFHKPFFGNTKSFTIQFIDNI